MATATSNRFRLPRARMWRGLAWLGLLAAGLWLLAGARAEDRPAAPGRVAVVLEISGAIGPASADYFRRGLAEARDRGAAIVILRMDTPGGLDTSMREMIRDILSSPIPVATYVAPSGSRAASAGTYILYASHIAAMAPGTNLGAATPVQVGGSPLPFPGQDEEQERSRGRDRDRNNDEPEAEAEAEAKDREEPEAREAAPEERRERARPDDPMRAKMVEDASAYIRGLAELRGRNAEWAERAVREAASLSSSEALEKNVIDIVARSVSDLLEQAHGRTVTMGEDNDRVLDTTNLDVEVLPPDWRAQFLAVITNPNFAFILMMIGIYGLIMEFSNPGALYPGTIGAISLILALYSLAVLPVNYAGLGLILLGLILMVAEAFAPSFGVLGVGGAIAFILGATMLFDTDVPGFQIAWGVIAVTTAASMLLLIVVLRLAWRSYRRPVVSGREYMLGNEGRVESWENGSGHVFIQGEHWNAQCDQPLEAGARVRVREVRGLVLMVEPTER